MNKKKKRNKILSAINIYLHIFQKLYAFMSLGTLTGQIDECPQIWKQSMLVDKWQNSLEMAQRWRMAKNMTCYDLRQVFARAQFHRSA